MTEPASPDSPMAKRDVRRKRSLLASTMLALFGRTGAAIGGFWVALTAVLGILAPFLANSRPITWLVRDEQGAWAREFPLFQFLTPQDVILSVGFVLGAVLCCFYRAGARAFWAWVLAMSAVVVCALVFHLEQEYLQLGTQYRAAEAQLAENDTTGMRRAVGEAAWQISKFWVIWSALGLGLLGLFAAGVVKLRHHKLWLGTGLGLAVVLGGGLLVPSLRVEPRPSVAYDQYRAQLKTDQAKGALFTLIPYSPDDIQIDAPVKPTSLSPGPRPSESDLAADMVSFMENSFDIRLYQLDQEAGVDVVTPSPVTIEQANAATDRVWSAYQEKNKDEPSFDRSEAESLNERVRKEMQAMAKTELGQRYHLMGTTSNGEDLTSRMIHGSRIALVIGFISTGIAVFIGIVIGGLLGYFAGWVDLIGLRLVEIFASIPVIMLLIMIVAFYGRSLILMMVVLGLTGWVGYAYFIRAEFLKLRNMDYVMAARASGTPLWMILFRHMLPNGVAPVLVGASFGIAGAIMTEATLSFLGLGLENEPSWGQMLNQARTGGSFSWWLAIYPGSAIFLTVFAYNLIGEALRDVIDPRAVK